MTQFIIDKYDKFNRDDRAAARYTFTYREENWAIKEYEVREGQLMRPLRIDERDDANEVFWRYDTYEDAIRFLQEMRKLG